MAATFEDSKGERRRSAAFLSWLNIVDADHTYNSIDLYFDPSLLLQVLQAMCVILTHIALSKYFGVELVSSDAEFRSFSQANMQANENVLGLCTMQQIHSLLLGYFS